MGPGAVAADATTNWIIVVPVLVGAAAMVMNLIINIRGGVWHTAGREEALKSEFRNAVDGLRSETTHNLAEINRDMNEGFKSTLQRFGETIQAMREKIHSNELYNEKEFLRKQEFYEHNRNTMALQAMGRSIDARFAQQDQYMTEILGRVRGEIKDD